MAIKTYKNTYYTYNIKCICPECKDEHKTKVNIYQYTMLKKKQPFRSLCDECFNKKKRR